MDHFPVIESVALVIDEQMVSILPLGPKVSLKISAGGSKIPDGDYSA